jgi:2-(1,2-epoxy-1,2-dihydrophenyl)acetyl-CoA isomerase
LWSVSEPYRIAQRFESPSRLAGKHAIGCQRNRETVQFLGRLRAVDEVLFTRRGPVARIALNRPDQLNALTRSTSTELLAALRAADVADVRAVVITGVGRAFCAGSDLKVNFQQGAVPAEETLRAHRHPVLMAIRALPKPVISAVNGVAAGIGVGLALAGDLVAACEDATFVLAFARIGLLPDGGTSWFLERAIGRPRAIRMAMLGESLTATEAAELGLVSHLAPTEQFEGEVESLAERLASGPTRAYGLMKQEFDAVGSLAEQLELEAQLQAQAARTDDFREGLSAFHDKRGPAFRGR